MKLAGLAAGFLMAESVFAQGSLTPPGAPGATMKTMDQLDIAIAGVSNVVSQVSNTVSQVKSDVAQVSNAVSEVNNAVEQVESRIDLATVAGDAAYHHIISQPGSYYLSGNLAVTNPSGISITATNVTLDLNGFTIFRCSGTGGDGICMGSTGDQTTLRNGHISGFQYGVNASNFADSPCLLNLTVSQCSSCGIYAAGSGVRIVDCIATRNSGIGISVGAGASLSGCTASYNQGIWGISASYGASLSGCTACYNQGNRGIYAGSGSTLSGCSAFYNTGSGSFSYGIHAVLGSVVMGCSAYYNSNTNSPSSSSQGVGIYVEGGTVKDCTVFSNLGDGICVYKNSLVSGNSSFSNGYMGDGAGIRAIFSDNRIENNNVIENDRGIDVSAIGNIIVRNTASDNTTNYVIVASNKVGFIVSAPNSGAISGSTGGSGVGSTDPWANFSF
jgi:parallel beta-helix repeat protein